MMRTKKNKKKDICILLYRALNEVLYPFNDVLTVVQQKRLLRTQIECLTVGAIEGDAEAQFTLSMCDGDSGYLIPNPFANKRKYVYWLKQSVKNGHADGAGNLSVWYLDSENEQKNIVLGLKLLFEAYAKGSGVAKLNYKPTLRQLKNKNSELSQELADELNNLKDKGQKFLNEHLSRHLI